MSIGINTKVTASVSGVVAIAGGGYLANQLFSGTKISELLKKDEYVLLNKGQDEEQWKKRWKEYVASKEDIWKLENYAQSSQDTEKVPDNFKNTCVYNASINVNDEKDSNYKNVAKFCTKGFAISSLIGQEKNIEVISESDVQNAKWKAVWANYFDKVKSEDPLDLKNLNSATKTSVPTNYKEKCDAKKIEEARNKKDISYLIFKNYCSKIRDS